MTLNEGRRTLLKAMLDSGAANQPDYLCYNEGFPTWDIKIVAATIEEADPLVLYTMKEDGCPTVSYASRLSSFYITDNGQRFLDNLQSINAGGAMLSATVTYNGFNTSVRFHSIDERLRCNDTPFLTSTGWEVNSVSVPEIEEYGSYLFIPGDKKDQDYIEISICGNYVNDMVTAINEYDEHWTNRFDEDSPPVIKSDSSSSWCYINDLTVGDYVDAYIDEECPDVYELYQPRKVVYVCTSRNLVWIEEEDSLTLLEGRMYKVVA